MRYSTKTLLAVIAVMAASCAGLTIATPFWGAAFYTGALLVVLAGFVAAIVRHGQARAYWIGFAMIAGGYYLAASRDGDTSFGPESLQYREPRLVTTHALMKANIYFAKIRPVTTNASVYYEFAGRVYMITKPELNFVQVGHGIFTLLFGLLGGWLGRWLYVREYETASAEA